MTIQNIRQAQNARVRLAGNFGPRTEQPQKPVVFERFFFVAGLPEDVAVDACGQ